MGAPAHKKEAERTFAALVGDSLVSPEMLLLAVMTGKEKITTDQGEVTISDRMISAAKDLLPYRLPRLNAIDFDGRTVEMTHEQWLAQMDQDDAD